MFFDNCETVLLVCTVMGGLLLALLWWQLVADMFDLNWINIAKGVDGRMFPLIVCLANPRQALDFLRYRTDELMTALGGRVALSLVLK